MRFDKTRLLDCGNPGRHPLPLSLAGHCPRKACSSWLWDDSSRQSSNLTNSHVTRLWINGLQEKSGRLATDDICKGTPQCTTTIQTYRNNMSKESRDLQVVYRSQVQGRSSRSVGKKWCNLSQRPWCYLTIWGYWWPSRNVPFARLFPSFSS